MLNRKIIMLCSLYIHIDPERNKDFQIQYTCVERATNTENTKQGGFLRDEMKNEII